MKVEWVCKSKNTTYDITEFVPNIAWSGSVNQASRQLEISVLYSPYDQKVKDINISLGDRIKLYSDEEILLINAMVYDRERKSEQGEVVYSGYDDLNHLLRSKGTYNFKNTTPEKVAKMICEDFKIQYRSFAITNVLIASLLFDAESVYAIIVKAYIKAHLSNGKKYMLFMKDRDLTILEKGELVDRFILQDGYNITSSTYTESLNNMINKVKIFDTFGNQIGEVKNDSWINDFGIFQEIYVKEEGINPNVAAKERFKGIMQESSIEAFGNIRCMSGYAVQIKDSLTGLIGKFYIDSDTHTWENGNHTMSLTLTFENLMDILDSDSQSKADYPILQNTSEVWLSKTSTKFHSNATCSGMTGASKTNQTEAKKQGKSACTKCWR